MGRFIYAVVVEIGMSILESVIDSCLECVAVGLVNTVRACVKLVGILGK